MGGGNSLDFYKLKYYSSYRNWTARWAAAKQHPLWNRFIEEK